MLWSITPSRFQMPSSKTEGRGRDTLKTINVSGQLGRTGNYDILKWNQRWEHTLLLLGWGKPPVADVSGQSHAEAGAAEWSSVSLMTAAFLSATGYFPQPATQSHLQPPSSALNCHPHIVQTLDIADTLCLNQAYRGGIEFPNVISHCLHFFFLTFL